jgi:hypothetical protein
MTRTRTTPRPSVATRRVGYTLAAAANAALLYLVNGWPGWQAVSFLTEDTGQVLGLVNLSLAVGLAANLVYLAHDGPRTESLGELVTTGVGLAVLVRLWQVFPFDFAGWSLDWSWLVRVLLGVGIVGSVIAIAVQLASLARQLGSGGARHGSSPRAAGS